MTVVGGWGVILSNINKISFHVFFVFYAFPTFLGEGLGWGYR